MSVNYGKLTNYTICTKDGVIFQALLSGHSRLFTLFFGVSTVFMTIFMTSLSDYIPNCLIYAFLFLICISRSVTLFLDPYHSEHFFSASTYDAIYYIDSLCLVSACAIVTVIIKKATRQRINANCINFLIGSNFVTYAIFVITNWNKIYPKVTYLKDFFVILWSCYVIYSLGSDCCKLRRSLHLAGNIGVSGNSNRSASQDVTFRVFYVNGIKPKIRIIDENEQSYSYHSEYSSTLAPPSPKVHSREPPGGRSMSDSSGHSLAVSNLIGQASHAPDLPQMIQSSTSASRSLFTDGRINVLNRKSKSFVNGIGWTTLYAFLHCIIQTIQVAKFEVVIESDTTCYLWLVMETILRVVELLLVYSLASIGRKTETESLIAKSRIESRNEIV